MTSALFQSCARTGGTYLIIPAGVRCPGRGEQGRSSWCAAWHTSWECSVLMTLSCEQDRLLSCLYRLSVAPVRALCPFTSCLWPVCTLVGLLPAGVRGHTHGICGPGSVGSLILPSARQPGLVLTVAQCPGKAVGGFSASGSLGRAGLWSFLGSCRATPGPGAHWGYRGAREGPACREGEGASVRLAWCG